MCACLRLIADIRSGHGLVAGHELGTDLTQQVTKSELEAGVPAHSAWCMVRSKHQFTNSVTQPAPHTPSAAFRHLPPNSATFGYATDGALFISAQLSTDDAVSALRKDPVLI